MCIFKNTSYSYNNAHTVIYTWHSYKPESPKLELTIVSTQSEAPNLRTGVGNYHLRFSPKYSLLSIETCPPGPSFS